MENLGGLFDIHKVNSLVNKVKATVLQYSEYEAKVKEITNNDPWGTAATEMMQHFHDIMNTIYKRFQEPSGPNWRQTYKALQLLEFLIVNGSEQVIDNARRHLYEIKALETYQYVDDKRKDQGINIRHRATKILELLGKDEMIRQERQKAKENREKYKGVSNHEMQSGSGGFGGSGNKYGGFGSDQVRSGGFSSNYDSQDRPSYNHHYQESIEPTAYSNLNTSPTEPKVTAAHIPVEAKPKQETNLLDFDDFSNFSSVPPANPSQPQDDFADFMAAPTVPTGQSVPPFNSTLSSKPTGFVQSQSIPAFANFGQQKSPTSAIFASQMAPYPSGTGQSMNFTPSQQSSMGQPMSFANFGSIPPKAQSPTAAFSQPAQQPTAPSSFASFGSIPPKAQSPTHGDFAAFSQPAQQPTSFANFGSSQKDDFGDFQASSATADPISKLVSLDAFSLASNGKKEQPGPSLNSLAGPYSSRMK